LPHAAVGLLAGLAVIAFEPLACAAGTAGGSPAWSYGGPDGPAHWGELDPAFATCATGRMQSPIDLAAANAEGTIVVSVHYRRVPLTILNNGHTVQFDGSGAGGLVSRGTDFDLVQAHFHTPAEYSIAGIRRPLDAHFVHRSADGSLTVLVASFVEGPPNPVLAAMMPYLPDVPSDAKTYPDIMVDPSGLLPADRAVYRYMGSLTTPPCTESVNWYVLRTATTASKEQIARFAAVLGMNARPVQPLNGRLLVAPPEGGS